MLRHDETAVLGKEAPEGSIDEGEEREGTSEWSMDEERKTLNILREIEGILYISKYKRTSPREMEYLWVGLASRFSFPITFPS